MNLITSTQDRAIGKAFQEQFLEWRPKGVNYSSTKPIVDEELFKVESVFPREVGTIYLGQTGLTLVSLFIIIKTKVGTVMVYQDPIEGEIKWFCDESYSDCQSAKEAGFIGTSGSFQSIEQLRHIFEVAKSYQ